MASSSPSQSQSQSQSQSSTSISLSTECEFGSLAHDAQADSFLTLVNLRAPFFEPDGVRERAGMDVVAVLDRSGSMAGSKMEMLHETVKLMIENLKEVDRLCLVSYDDRIETNLPLTAMSKEGKELARRALGTIRDRGSTDLLGGLVAGLSVLKARGEGKNEVASVLLLTDGLANAGVRDAGAIVAQTKTFMSTLNNPTSVYCFGYGSDHDSSLLASIADAGNGTYYFMETNDSVPQAFADCLGGLMSVVAQNIRLTLTAAPGVRINTVNTAFHKTEDQAGAVWTVTIGDLFSEEERDVLVDVSVPAVSGPMEAHELVYASVRYTNVIAAATEQAAVTGVLERTAPQSGKGGVSERVDAQRNRLLTAQAMEQAKQLGDMGRLDEARHVIAQVQGQIGQSRSATMSAGMVADLCEVSEQMQSAQTYSRQGQQRLMAKSQKHYMQRGNECLDVQEEAQSAGFAMYSNASKASAKKSWKAAFSK